MKVNPDEIPLWFAIPAIVVLWWVVIVGWIRQSRQNRRIEELEHRSHLKLHKMRDGQWVEWDK